MVRVSTPDEEDAKRPHREREHLIQERLHIENRIEALLFTQGDLGTTVATFMGTRHGRAAHRRRTRAPALAPDRA